MFATALFILALAAAVALRLWVGFAIVKAHDKDPEFRAAWLRARVSAI